MVTTCDTEVALSEVALSEVALSEVAPQRLHYLRLHYLRLPLRSEAAPEALMTQAYTDNSARRTKISI